MEKQESLVDPQISRAKFEREVAEYRKHEDDYIRRGWWMVKAEFPEIFMVFGTSHIKPPIAAFGASIDFTNYDFWPPSVKLVDPFTREPYPASQLPISGMPRKRKFPAEVPEQPQPGVQIENLLQAQHPEQPPFICVPGIREYHEHPAHSGDSWLLHRDRGEGTLYFVLNLLGTYGLGAVKGLSIQLQVGIQPPTVDQVPE